MIKLLVVIMCCKSSVDSGFCSEKALRQIEHSAAGRRNSKVGVTQGEAGKGCADGGGWPSSPSINRSTGTDVRAALTSPSAL